MKEHIDGVLDYKNRTINILLEELEMAEKQYSHNFQAHVVKIQTFIGKLLRKKNNPKKISIFIKSNLRIEYKNGDLVFLISEQS